MAQKNSAVGPVVRNGVHFESSQEECSIGHSVGEIVDTLPALECILDSSAVLDEMLGVELVIALLLQHGSEDVRVDDAPNKGLHDNHKRQEAWASVGDQKWDHCAIEKDKSHKDIVGAERIKVLEDDQVPSEVGAVNVLCT